MADADALAATLAMVRDYRKTSLDMVKGLRETVEVSDILDKSLNAEGCTGAIVALLGKIGEVEEVVYDLNIIKMEARSILAGTPDTAVLRGLRQELKALLSIVGDCVGIARARYDFLGTALGGVRSVNSNFRTLGRHAVQADPRHKK